MNYLIYFAFGGIEYKNEILYSILSYYKFHHKNENQILIYSDDVAFFKSKIIESIIYHEIDNQTITEWKGTLNFVHRLKVKVIQDATSKYNGNFLYLDSDTFFTKNCSEIFENISKNNIYFDRCEGKLIDNPGGIAKKIRNFLKKENKFSIPSISNLIILDENFVVWNAGVIGFCSSYTKYLKNVEEFVDVLYSKFQLFIIEQLSFNYFFQQNITPIASENFIHHYWYFKEFRVVLKHFFEFHQSKYFDDLIQEIDKINPEYLSTEKRAYKKMSFFNKQIQKLRNGRKWKILNYNL